MTAPDELGDLLGFATRGIGEVDLTEGDLHHLSHTVDRLLNAGVALQRHLLYDPGAQIDRHGRCTNCGRLFAMPPRPRMFGGDGKRGCAYLPAIVIAHARWAALAAMSVPFAGKALWLSRHRGGA